MKIRVIQPRYSFDPAELDACRAELAAEIKNCDSTLDLIVLPEYSDVPADIHGEADFHKAIEDFNAELLTLAADTAKRCSALVFVNAGYKTESGWRNTTHVFGRGGEVLGRYFKAHPAPS